MCCSSSKKSGALLSEQGLTMLYLGAHRTTLRPYAPNLETTPTYPNRKCRNIEASPAQGLCHGEFLVPIGALRFRAYALRLWMSGSSVEGF